MARAFIRLGSTLTIAAIVLGGAPAGAQDLFAAKISYTTYCAQCHGATGQGNGPSAATLMPKPRNFSDCKLMASIPDATLANVIRNGGGVARLNPAMPAWRDVLSPDQIDGLVAYVRTFCGKK